MSIVVSISGAAATLTEVHAYPAGPVIEGWQRVQGAFAVGANQVLATIRLQAGTTKTAYFDDVRVVPLEASLESFVYDPRTMRLSARLDDNNHATLFSYGPAGELILVRRETELGIVTVEEDRLHGAELQGVPP